VLDRIGRRNHGQKTSPHSDPEIGSARR
jgi:hypothetical protein